MSDKELCKAFGTTLEEIDSDVETFESGAWNDFKFGAPVEGRPQAKMKTTSLKFYDFELAAIDAAAHIVDDTGFPVVHRRARPQAHRLHPRPAQFDGPGDPHQQLLPRHGARL